MIILAIIGLLFVFSATYTPEQPYSLFFKKQIIGLILGIPIYCICTFIDHRSYMRWGYFGYFGLIILLIFTLIKGSIAMGGQRWINLIFFKLQPSELAKILLPAFIAHHIYLHHTTMHRYIKDFIPILCVLGISFILILKQPDLGTALLIAFTGLLLVWFAGIPKHFFVYGLCISMLATPLLWHCLKPYQKNRILVFLGQGNKQKERYQIEQSVIAVGSGGFLGKGFLRGTQNKFNFLPESRTDFIFAVICEEWGLIGALCILFLYSFLFIRLLFFIQYIPAQHIKLLAIGITMSIILATIINICMVLGLLPIVGIPLPLMSYGLSNLWVTCASLGILQSILMQQQHIRSYTSHAQPLFIP